MPAVLLHILIRNMNEVAEIEVFQLVGNNLLQRAVPVSYTHLDVYKRQWLHGEEAGAAQY